MAQVKFMVVMFAPKERCAALPHGNSPWLTASSKTSPILFVTKNPWELALQFD
jgi:hypothetical protein